MTQSASRHAPGWLKVANRLVQTMVRHGVAPSAHHVLSVPGRRSGALRSTPVAVLEFEGKQYLVAGYAGSDWVKNAQKSGWGVLRRGKRERKVRLTELPVVERVPILQHFAKQVRGGRSFLTVASDAPEEEFAKAAADHPIFRIDEGS